MAEWRDIQRWNPFNSYKLLAHVERWKLIQKGIHVPPVLVTVDPVNACNFDCEWCNASQVKNRHLRMSGETLINLAHFLGQWKIKTYKGEYSVLGQCLAGGGEPLLHQQLSEYIDITRSYDIEVGVVTNGALIYNHYDALSKCTWVGVSIDAATNETFQKYKNPKCSIDDVFYNIKMLVGAARSRKARLASPHPSYGISYKYLLYKDNINEVFQAAEIAKKIGCKNIHYRPASTTWDKLGEQEITFTEAEIDEFNRQIKEAQKLADESFGVYGITHKFNSQFDRKHNFDECWGIFMTAVFMPALDGFTMGLCCDRRGDPKLELLTNCSDVNEIEKAWGNQKHIDIHNSIVPCKECPRCTYSPANEIYEQVIVNDSMTYKFI